MRTTVEITDRQRAKLLELAAARGENGFSRLVQEAIDLYLDSQAERHERVQAARLVFGSIDDEAADALEESVRPGTEQLAVIVADSDVLIDTLRGREPSRTRIDLAMEAGGLATTVITAYELWSGARTESERAKIDQLLEALDLLPIDAEASFLAADCRRRLEAEGKSIGTADYLIAGVCLARAATLLTRNRNHFARVPGLHVVGPDEFPADVRESSGRPLRTSKLRARYRPAR